MFRWSDRRRRFVLVMPLALVALALGAMAAYATLTPSTFNAADGNLVVSAGEQDWANLPAAQLSKAEDKPTGQTDDSLGNGTKEDDAVPSVTDGSIPNNKSDLTRFYVGKDKISGKDFLYLAWERVQEPTGTTNMDFEFNQSSTLSSNGVTPARTAGDVLVKYDLSQGGVNPSLGYHRWVTSGAGSQCEAANKTPCWDKVHPLSGANFEGSINTVSVVDPIRIGAQSADRTLSPRTFGEAAINLTDGGILPTVSCTTFGKAYLKSRSSDSFTSAVKDFIAPIPVNITNCAGIKVIKKDGTANGPALDGAEFTLYNDNAPIGGSRGAEDASTGSTCTTSGGECSFSNVAFGEYWVVETKTPAGYNTAPDQHVTLSSGGGDATVTFVDPRKHGAIRVVKTDDANNPMTGVQFSLKGTSDLGTAVDTTCTTGLDGKCSFSDLELGTYTLDEVAGSLAAEYSSDPSLPKSVKVESDGQIVTVNVTNPRKHKVIVLVCHEGTNTLFAVNVDKGASTLQSLGTAPSGLTDATLCGLGGAAYTHLDHGDQTLTVHIAHP